MYAAAGDSAGGHLVLSGLGLQRKQGHLAALQKQPEALILLSPAVFSRTAHVSNRALLLFVCTAAAGDSAGGNLVLTGLGLLREQGRLAALAKQPEALILLSPAVDMSNSSVFARGEPVSSHIDADGDSAAVAAPLPAAAVEEDAVDASGVRSEAVISQNESENGSSEAAPAAVDGKVVTGNTGEQQQPKNSSSSSSSHASLADLKQRILQHHHEQQHLTKQQQRQHQVGGPAGPLQLLLGLAGEMEATWKAHRSKAGAAAAAAAGWFDYLPGSSVADNIHHYLHVSVLCSRDPLVRTYMYWAIAGLLTGWTSCLGCRRLTTYTTTCT
jgi:hypothetical protein